MKRNLVRWAAVFSVPLIFLSAVPGVNAGFSRSELTSLSPTNRESDLRTIQKFLETKILRAKLVRLGFTEEEIQSRLSRLDPEQLHGLALKADELMVGGDLGIGIGIGLLAALVLVLIISAIAYFSGMDEA